jgi:hypothetical protein
MASEAFVEGLMIKMNDANMAAIAKMIEHLSLNQKSGSSGMVEQRSWTPDKLQG